MLKQISFAGIAFAAMMGISLSVAQAFPGFVPNAVLAATKAESRQPMVASAPAPAAERAPMVVRIGGRAHLFDGYFYCEKPQSPLPKAFEAMGRKTPRQILSFLDR